MIEKDTKFIEKDTKLIKIPTNYLTNEKKIKEKKIKEPSIENKKIVKRVVCENWNFTIDDYLHENQLRMVQNIYDNSYNHMDNITKIAVQQINAKISGYKQQDLLKKKYDKDEFLHLKSVIDKMIECQLKCYYCMTEMNVLYDISREMKQWTVDRIDNDKGHNINNFYLACLECNLKRRRRSDDKFLFTKQMKLIKVEN